MIEIPKMKIGANAHRKPPSEDKGSLHQKDPGLSAASTHTVPKYLVRLTALYDCPANNTHMHIDPPSWGYNMLSPTRQPHSRSLFASSRTLLIFMLYGRLQTYLCIYARVCVQYTVHRVLHFLSTLDDRKNLKYELVTKS